MQRQGWTNVISVGSSRAGNIHVSSYKHHEKEKRRSHVEFRQGDCVWTRRVESATRERTKTCSILTAVRGYHYFWQPQSINRCGCSVDHVKRSRTQCLIRRLYKEKSPSHPNRRSTETSQRQPASLKGYVRHENILIPKRPHKRPIISYGGRTQCWGCRTFDTRSRLTRKCSCFGDNRVGGVR